MLTALYEEVDHRVSEAEGELFDVLASCGGVAIANSMTYENVVRAEEHHAGVIDGIADGVAVLDAYGLVTAWNKAAAELTGVPGGPGDRPALPAARSAAGASRPSTTSATTAGSS